MTTDIQRLEADLRVAARPLMAWSLLAPVIAAAEGASVLVSAIISSALFYWLAYDEPFWHSADFNFELTVAIFFVLVRALRGDYAYATYIAPSGNFGRICRAWLLAFLTLLAAMFLLKVGSHHSRGVAVSLFLAGPAMLALVQKLVAGLCVTACQNGRLAARRIFVIGSRSGIEDYRQSVDAGLSGHAVVGTFALGDESERAIQAELITRAVAAARHVDPDDILIAVPLTDHARIQELVEACKVIPASIHLGVGQLLKEYPALRTVRAGDSASLELVREPLTPLEQFAKRSFDIVVAGMALVLLSPLFLFVAIAIKWGSEGPVFFRQERHCYNRRTFRIYKFRTMYDQGAAPAAFRQATRDDPRITPIGTFLRRTNIDELPQLLNVIAGDMSIVGPRPHAIEHDEDFEQRIAYYSRRHNIKPGITGWAQVNGLRGETDTDDKMRARIEHDLSYLDHWSMLLDLKIILLTVISPKAYRNAV